MDCLCLILYQSNRPTVCLLTLTGVSVVFCLLICILFKDAHGNLKLEFSEMKKKVERNGRYLIKIKIPHLAGGADENHE